MCQLDTPNFLIYLHLLTAFFCFFSASFILLNSKKNPANLNIVIFIFILGIWTVFDMLQWIITSVSLNLFFGRLTTLISIMTLFFLYFTYHFTEREIDAKKKILLALPFLPIFIFLFTDYNFAIFNAADCGFTQGPLFYYVYFIAFLYMIWAVVLLIKKYVSETTSANIKLQTRILMLDIALFIFWIIFFAIVENYAILGNNDEFENEVSSFFLLGIMVFIAVLVYAIYKGALLELSKLSKNIFVGVLWAILFLIIFVIQPGTTFSIAAFVLYLFLITIFWIL